MLLRINTVWCCFRSQVFVWSAEFDLELGGMASTLVWEVEYASEDAVSQQNTKQPSVGRRNFCCREKLAHALTYSVSTPGVSS